MTGNFALVIVFLATFLLVFTFFTYLEQGPPQVDDTITTVSALAH
jgi:hypothetical protein